MTDMLKMAAVLVTQDEALDPLTAARRVNRCGQVQKKALVSEGVNLISTEFQPV
jgi:hypothetical protein